jgi:SIR2-like domain
MRDPLDAHYTTVIKAIMAGRVVPFLGAGVNLCGRPEGTTWQQGKCLPSGGELASYLADNFGCPLTDREDLVRVSQYVEVMNSFGPLYEELHKLFDADYPPNSLHRLLARLPALLRDKGSSHPYQLIVTTNYDDILERAFRAEREPFEVVSYIAEGEQRGRFLHWFPDGKEQLIEKPNEYSGLLLDENRNLLRPVILKLHGAVNRVNGERDSFVITEDHYIDYLTRSDVSKLVPAVLAEKLMRSHFLFLGYSLRDWNLRVILYRIWGEQTRKYKSWAVQLNPQDLDHRFWMKRDVDILNSRLESYIATLGEHLHALPRA